MEAFAVILISAFSVFLYNFWKISIPASYVVYDFCSIYVPDSHVFQFRSNYVQRVYNLCTTFVQLLYRYCTTLVQLLYDLRTTFVKFLLTLAEQGLPGPRASTVCSFWDNVLVTLWPLARVPEGFLAFPCT